MEVKSILPGWLICKRRGTLDREEKKRRKEGKVNNSSKNAYGAEVFCPDHPSNERPQNYRHSHLGIAPYGICAGVDKRMGDASMTTHMQICVYFIKFI